MSATATPIPTVESLFASVLTLPETERVRLYHLIEEQLFPVDAEIDAALLEEARRRWEDYKGGRVQLLSEEEFFAEPGKC